MINSYLYGPPPPLLSKVTYTKPNSSQQLHGVLVSQSFCSEEKLASLEVDFDLDAVLNEGGLKSGRVVWALVNASGTRGRYTIPTMHKMSLL